MLVLLGGGREVNTQGVTRIQKFVSSIRYLRRRSRLQSQLLINMDSRAICRVEGGMESVPPEASMPTLLKSERINTCNSKREEWVKYLISLF